MAADDPVNVTHIPSPDLPIVDVEKTAHDAHLLNTTVHDFTWQGVTVTVKDRKTKEDKRILDDIQGIVTAGELCALLGPSGSGKSTLLNVLAHRAISSGATIEGSVLVNGASPSLTAFRQLSSYVEQDDALIGSLTVRETMSFAARLAHTHGLSKTERMRRIDSLLDSFGLRKQEHTLIGTPIRSGISGGQKRRVSVASQLITSPKVLFLDEPTSGLDSLASWEVVSFIKKVAKENNLIVIMSIHQPSTKTFQLFDKALLLSAGRSHYFGSVTEIEALFNSLGCPMPPQMNPAEFVLDILNTDFASDQEGAGRQLEQLQLSWVASPQNKYITQHITAVNQDSSGEGLESERVTGANFFATVLALVHRSWIKSYRDVFAYGVRIAMYTGLAIMMGTVWLRLGSDQRYIQPFINSIFFGAAFISFMAVSYVPAYLEDRAVYIKEGFHNGLYGPVAFLLANFLIGLPFLFLIDIIFSVVVYWLSGFQPTGVAFFSWIMWLFLDLLAAESLVVLVTSVLPNGVLALAVVAFSNGLWMSVGGFLVPSTILNVFYKYVFHYIDYQAYVFQGMMVNEFSQRIYTCESNPTGCHCQYKTELESQCQISGQGVLDQYGYFTGQTGLWVGILLGIVLGYRLLGWLALVLRH